MEKWLGLRFFRWDPHHNEITGNWSWAGTWGANCWWCLTTLAPFMGPPSMQAVKGQSVATPGKTPNCAMIFQRTSSYSSWIPYDIMQWVHISAMLSIFWAMQKAFAKVWSHNFIDFSRLQAHRTIAPMDVRVTQTPALARRWSKYNIIIILYIFFFEWYLYSFLRGWRNHANDSKFGAVAGMLIVFWMYCLCAGTNGSRRFKKEFA